MPGRSFPASASTAIVCARKKHGGLSRPHPHRGHRRVRARGRLQQHRLCAQPLAPPPRFAPEWNAYASYGRGIRNPLCRRAERRPSRTGTDFHCRAQSGTPRGTRADSFEIGLQHAGNHPPPCAPAPGGAPFPQTVSATSSNATPSWGKARAVSPTPSPPSNLARVAHGRCGDCLGLPRPHASCRPRWLGNGPILCPHARQAADHRPAPQHHRSPPAPSLTSVCVPATSPGIFRLTGTFIDRKTHLAQSTRRALPEPLIPWPPSSSSIDLNGGFRFNENWSGRLGLNNHSPTAATTSWSTARRGGGHGGGAADRNTQPRHQRHLHPQRVLLKQASPPFLMLKSLLEKGPAPSSRPSAATGRVPLLPPPAVRPLRTMAPPLPISPARHLRLTGAPPLPSTPTFLLPHRAPLPFYLNLCIKISAPITQAARIRNPPHGGDPGRSCAHAAPSRPLLLGGAPPETSKRRPRPLTPRLSAPNSPLTLKRQVTVEGRIRDFTQAKGRAWTQAPPPPGANRFSLGLQSTDTDLAPPPRSLFNFCTSPDREEIRRILNDLGETGRGAHRRSDLWPPRPKPRAASPKTSASLPRVPPSTGSTSTPLRRFPHRPPSTQAVASGRRPAFPRRS